MKKKIIGGIAVLAIAAVAAFNVNMNTQETNLSLLSLANVEALAGENDGSKKVSKITDTSTDVEVWNHNGNGKWITCLKKTRACSGTGSQDCTPSSNIDC